MIPPLFAAWALVAVPSGPRHPPQPQEPEAPATVPGPEPESALEFALSDASVQLALERPMRRGGGMLRLGALGTEDDDLAFSAHFLRTGPLAASGFTFGAGLGAYAVFVDRPDRDAYAIALSGAAAYGFDVGSLPAEVGVAASYAPDVTTFDDGDGLFDGLVRLQVDLNDFAAAFVGYLFLEVELDGRSDADVEDRLHLGIRLAL